MRVKNIIFGILVHVCENGKYLESIIDDAVITYSEIIELFQQELSQQKLFQKKLFQQI